MSRSSRSLWRSNKANPFTGLGGVLASTALLGFGTSWTYISYKKALGTPYPTPEEISSIDLQSVWKEKEGGRYDDEIAWDEWLAGISKKRRALVQLAHGRVLESAAGTGRNAAAYDQGKVQSLTLVDQSTQMLERARTSWYESNNAPRWRKIKARFLVGDLSGEEVTKVLKPEPMTTSTQGHLSFPGITTNDAVHNTQSMSPSNLQTIHNNEGNALEQEKFDTIVQTMGLCSTPDPVKLLKNLEKVVKKNGKILLLEHGKSHYDWINEILDRTSVKHAVKHGCWWNRDIDDIVEKSGLKVEEIKRYNFGTVWWIILSPGEQQQSV